MILFKVTIRSKVEYDTEAPFLDLHPSTASGFVTPKIYDKSGDFDFDIVNFAFLKGDVPHHVSYGEIHHCIHFATYWVR